MIHVQGISTLIIIFFSFLFDQDNFHCFIGIIIRIRPSYCNWKPKNLFWINCSHCFNDSNKMVEDILFK